MNGRYSEVLKNLSNNPSYWAPYQATVRQEYRGHVEVLRSIVLEIAEDKIPEKWKRDILRNAIRFDDNNIEVDPNNKVAIRVENGDPDGRGRDMRSYNWNWKTDGKGRRYVDVKMDRPMGKVEAYASQAATGKHPGGSEGIPLMDFLRQGVKAHMDVTLPGGQRRTVVIGTSEGRARVPPKTVQKINDNLHVSDPFAAGKMLASSYSTSGGTRLTGMRIWRRLWADEGAGVTWMAPAWKAADIFKTAEQSAPWREELERFKQFKEDIVLTGFKNALGV